MTTNPLNQRAFAIRAVLADVGWITHDEQKDVRSLLPDDALVHFTTDLQELHLYWPMYADTMTDAITQATQLLNKAAEATGVTVPRTRRFEVNEIGQ